MGKEGPFPLAEFRSRLKQWIAETPSPSVAISGTEKVIFGDSVTVMEEVRRAGISVVSVDTVIQPTPRY